ncbi:plasmid segregation protein ParM domain-containing protein [Vibrio sp. PNB22_3_1]
MDLLVVMDDGSQQGKMAWICPKSGELKKLVVPNALRRGWKSAALRDDIKVFNFTIDERKFTYDLTSEDSLSVKNIDWQLSMECVVSVHYALLQTGLSPDEYPRVKLVATLPITQYYNTDDLQKNTAMIEKKKANLMRPVQLNGGKTFQITEVAVMPESAPSVMSSLVDAQDVSEFTRSLVVDVGGVTTDLAIIRSKFEDITSVTGNSKLGVSRVTQAAMNALINADSECSWHVANQLVVRRHDLDFVKQVINDHSKIDVVLSLIERAITEFACAVVEECKRFCSSPNRVYLVGGGGSLIFSAIQEAYSVLGDKVILVDGCDSALAVELMKMHAVEALEIAAA